MRQNEQAHYWLSSTNYEIRPYDDATLAACNRFRSNFNFLFINVFLRSIYLFAYVAIVIRFLTGQLVNQLLLQTLHCIKYLK